MGTECPGCGEEYKSIGQHWRYNNHKPDFTNRQLDIITGLLMGDASLQYKSDSPNLDVSMTSPNYLEYLNDIFGCLGTSVSLKSTGPQSAGAAANGDLIDTANVNTYKNVYRWYVRSHDQLQKFADWYSTGEKVWPKDIDLTPTVLKHWYCGDGTWANNGDNNYICIALSNELGNEDKIDSYFENAGLPKPSRHYTNLSEDGDHVYRIEFNVSESKELWNYMGNPLPDFYYKWPEKYH